jgi:hypothetical protein
MGPGAVSIAVGDGAMILGMFGRSVNGLLATILLVDEEPVV